MSAPKTEFCPFCHTLVQNVNISEALATHYWLHKLEQLQEEKFEAIEAKYKKAHKTLREH